ncbi:MAG: XRE family transcriptional regulator [Desulfobacterales bacterium]|nr:XRE family transcriptional regulator [Desulfobacterales bacterium]MDX2512313.1 XRE family transcriptional regulator [Desulfobacterales bacterium]
MSEQNQKPPINVDYFEDLTGDIAKTSVDPVESVGERIRVLRQEKGLSLEELSRLTGFEIAFLEDLENNNVQPQLGTSIKLSRALDSAFGRIVSGVGNKLYSITRKNEEIAVSRSTSKKGKKEIYSYMSLAPDVKGRNMEALIVKLKENPDEEVSIHEGEEFIYVLEGIVSLKIGADAFELEPGDSAYYLSTTPHLIAAKSGEAKIIAVLYGR